MKLAADSCQSSTLSASRATQYVAVCFECEAAIDRIETLVGKADSKGSRLHEDKLGNVVAKLRQRACQW